jgi:hypothetical protein
MFQGDKRLYQRWLVIQLGGRLKTGHNCGDTHSRAERLDVEVINLIGLLP